MLQKKIFLIEGYTLDLNSLDMDFYTPGLEKNIFGADPEGKKMEVSLKYTVDSPYIFELKSDDFQIGAVQSQESPFIAFSKLQLILEKMGWVILCNGSRRDVQATKNSHIKDNEIYIEVIPDIEDPLKNNHLINLLDPAIPEDVTILAVQEKVRQRLPNSLFE